MSDKNLLVVEDEAPIRDMLRFALERAEFRVGHDNMSPYLVLNYIIALQGIFPSRN